MHHHRRQLQSRTQTDGRIRARSAHLPRYRRSVMRAATSLLLIAALFASLQRDVNADTTHPAPDASLSAQQVVQIVVDALQDNDAASDDGIATVYRFASPANKRTTGPLSRFRAMIHQGFPDMLNHSQARYEPMQVDGDIAWQTVWLRLSSGREYGYGFKLRRQSGGEHDGAWMTDAVVPLGQSSTSGLRI